MKNSVFANLEKQLGQLDEKPDDKAKNNEGLDNAITKNL